MNMFNKLILLLFSMNLVKLASISTQEFYSPNIKYNKLYFDDISFFKSYEINFSEKYTYIKFNIKEFKNFYNKKLLRNYKKILKNNLHKNNDNISNVKESDKSELVIKDKEKTVLDIPPMFFYRLIKKFEKYQSIIDAILEYLDDNSNLEFYYFYYEMDSGKNYSESKRKIDNILLSLRKNIRKGKKYVMNFMNLFRI